MRNRNLWPDVSDRVIVTDASTGVHYKNISVLRCNVQSDKNSNVDVRAWNKEYVGPSPMESQIQQYFNEGSGSERFLSDISDTPPEGVIARRCGLYFTYNCDISLEARLVKDIANSKMTKICDEWSKDKDIYKIETNLNARTEPGCKISSNLPGKTTFRNDLRALFQLNAGAKNSKVSFNENYGKLGWTHMECWRKDTTSNCSIRYRCDPNYNKGDGCFQPQALLMVVAVSPKAQVERSTNINKYMELFELVEIEGLERVYRTRVKRTNEIVYYGKYSVESPKIADDFRKKNQGPYLKNFRKTISNRRGGNSDLNHFALCLLYDQDALPKEELKRKTIAEVMDLEDCWDILNENKTSDCDAGYCSVSNGTIVSLLVICAFFFFI